MTDMKVDLLTEGELDNPEWIGNYPKIVINSYRQLQAALAAKEAELEAVKATALDDRVKAKQELARVKEHLQEIVWERDDLLGQRDDLLSHVGKLKQQLDTLLAEAVWAMEILTACERLRRLPLPGDIHNAQAFLARPDVQARQKEGA